MIISLARPQNHSSRFKSPWKWNSAYKALHCTEFHYHPFYGYHLNSAEKDVKHQIIIIIIINIIITVSVNMCKKVKVCFQNCNFIKVSFKPVLT